jgi:hypothetical protein
MYFKLIISIAMFHNNFNNIIRNVLISKEVEEYQKNLRIS